MGKRIARCALILLVSFAVSGCIAYKKDDEGTRVNSVGVASAKECVYYEGREDGVIKECTEVTTDAFSAWETVITGIGNVLVRVMTFGFKGG